MATTRNSPSGRAKELTNAFNNKSQFSTSFGFNTNGGLPRPRLLGGAPDVEESLGQLAAVLETVARLDTGGELKSLCEEVIQARSDFKYELDRRKDVEAKLRARRQELDQLRDSRREMEAETAATKRKIQHLQDELGFVSGEVESAEDERQQLQAHNDGANDGSKGGRLPPPHGSTEEDFKDILAKVRQERGMLSSYQTQIEVVRSQLDSVLKDKIEEQKKQQHLLEKQRQTEQDRGLMLTAIEAERGKLSKMRSQRIQLSEERSNLEAEMTKIAQERWQTATAEAHSFHHGLGHMDVGRSEQMSSNPPIKGIPANGAPRVYTATPPFGTPGSNRSR